MRRDGNSLVSANAFTPDAISQYKDALSQETRDAIKFRASPDATGAQWNAKRLVLNAHDANAFFEKHHLSITAETQEASVPQR